jgi:hypothetical protein
MVLRVNGLVKIIGIVSASIANPYDFDGKIKYICNLNNYLVYTDVSKFYNWINQVILETGLYPDILRSISIPSTTTTVKSTADDRLYFSNR